MNLSNAYVPEFVTEVIENGFAITRKNLETLTAFPNWI